MFFTCFFYSCTTVEHQSPRYVQLAHEITDKTAKKLEKKKGLVLVGTGGGMMNDIQMMMMGFSFYEVVSIEEARKLLIYSVELYLKRINTNEEIRPHLHDDPFTEKNVEIVIYFHDSKGYDVPKNNINIAAARDGSLIYYIDAPDTHGLKTIHRESYKEALNIVNNAKMGLSKAS